MIGWRENSWHPERVSAVFTFVYVLSCLSVCAQVTGFNLGTWFLGHEKETFCCCWNVHFYPFSNQGNVYIDFWYEHICIYYLNWYTWLFVFRDNLCIFGGFIRFLLFLLLSIDGVLFSINTYKWLEYLFFKWHVMYAKQLLSQYGYVVIF